MTSRTRQAIHGLTPPALSRIAAGRSKHATRFVDGFSSWTEAAEAGSGYGHASILDQVVRATEEVIAGRASFERDGAAFADIEYRWPLAAGVLWQAARDQGRVRVLDFGGSLGSTFRQHARLLDGLDVRWGVVEQPAFVAAGRAYATEQLTFHETVSSCVQAIAPTTALFSSVLQYLPDPHAVVREVAAVPGLETIIIDRTPMSDEATDTPALQVVPSTIYPGSYACWLMSPQLLANSLAGWEVVDTFPGIEPDARTKHGLDVYWLGMTLSRR